MNFLAVTFDAPEEARAFVARYKFRWRIVPDAREFIDRMRVKHYPTMALFDANGRLLGTQAVAACAMSSRRPTSGRSLRAGSMDCCAPAGRQPCPPDRRVNRSPGCVLAVGP